MILRGRTRTFFVALLIPALNACATEPDWRKTWNPVTPLDEVRIIVQICLPDKTVSFEDVEVDLNGIPKAKTLREEREANGYREAGSNRSNVLVIEGQADPDRVTVRSWVPGHQAGEVKRSFLGFGEILNRDGLLSAGGGQIHLWSNSDKNQPIYETEGHRQNETIALDVSEEVEKDGKSEFLTYWYKLPSEIPTGKFSNWLEPISQETKEDKERSRNPTFWNLTHGRGMEIHPVKSNAPKIRYKLITVEDYYNENRFWKRAQKAVAQKYYKGISPEERQRVHFVPRVKDTIPGC